MIVSKLGGKPGMQPAITPKEEKVEQLSRVFTRLRPAKKKSSAAAPRNSPNNGLSKKRFNSL